MAAVITQFSSYMIDKGVRYGYICTGEVFVFLQIDEDDPACVYYSMNLPREDYLAADQRSQLQRTAVAQAFAFIQQATASEPLSQSWMDKAVQSLRRWKVEFIDILKNIPETERRSRDTSAYQPSE